MERRRECGPRAKGALVAWWLLMEGPLTVAMVAERLYETKTGAWRLLNDLGSVLPIINDKGWWYVDIKALADVRRLHEISGAELRIGHPDMAFSRPFRRDDVERIYRLTGELLRAGVPARQSEPATLVHEEVQP